MRPTLEEKIKNWATEIGIEAGEKVAELKKDEWLAEGTQKGMCKMVKKMIDSGKLSLDDISAFSGLSIEEVKKIAMVR